LRKALSAQCNTSKKQKAVSFAGDKNKAWKGKVSARPEFFKGSLPNQQKTRSFLKSHANGMEPPGAAATPPLEANAMELGALTSPMNVKDLLEKEKQTSGRQA